MIEEFHDNLYDMINHYHIQKGGYIYEEEAIRNHIKNELIV